MSRHAVRRMVLSMVAVALWTASAACAPQAPGEQDNAAEPGVNHRLPEADRDCLAWTDGCVNCLRAKPGDDFTCSNIGIACQPKEVVCQRRASPPPTTPPAK